MWSIPTPVVAGWSSSTCCSHSPSPQPRSTTRGAVSGAQPSDQLAHLLGRDWRRDGMAQMRNIEDLRSVYQGDASTPVVVRDP